MRTRPLSISELRSLRERAADEDYASAQDGDCYDGYGLLSRLLDLYSEAHADAQVLTHAYDTDNRPPEFVLTKYRK